MNTHKVLRYFAFFGNSIYILWILYNGLDEGFRNIASVQAIASIGLIFFLILDIILLHQKG